MTEVIPLNLFGIEWGLDPKWRRRSRWNDDDDGDTEDKLRTITDDDEIDKVMRC